MEGGLVKVRSPIRDAPAAKAGVMANDIITHLDGEATQGMTNGQALEKMRGPVNTTVRLRIARKGQDVPIELTIVRAGIRLAGAEPHGATVGIACSRKKRSISRAASGPCGSV